MFRTRVLTLLWLFVPLVNCFNWDIVVGEDKRLEFYYNGTLTHTEDIPSAYDIHSVAYDPVHYRVLFADKHRPNISISSFDLSTRKIQLLVTKESDRNHVKIVYDPVTQLLFWRQHPSIYSFSLNPTSSNKAADVNVLMTSYYFCWDIAVDICGGYLYWITNQVVERARFDGSEREVLVDSYVNFRLSMALDQQTQKIYWTEITGENGDYQLSIESADLNGKNRTKLYNIGNVQYGFSLAVSKDFIYWKNFNQEGIWQLPKIPSKHVEGKLFSKSNSGYWFCHRIAAYYTIKEQIQGTKSCEKLHSLIPNDSKLESTVSICQNYCFQGDCSVSAEGQPTCSCKVGYSGERCEVNTCHKHCLNNGVCSLNEENAPVCQCTADYDGERCEISICKDYCLQGNCSIGTEGQPVCSCKAGYSGERCEVNACYKHCLNNGVCFLNEEDDAVCECTADYEGVRCDIATTCTGVHAENTTPQVLRDLYSAVKQIIKEELEHTLQSYSDKIDEIKAQIQKCENSISDIKNRCTGLQYYDESTPKTQTSN